jgi:hypothetical protein
MSDESIRTSEDVARLFDVSIQTITKLKNENLEELKKHGLNENEKICYWTYGSIFCLAMLFENNLFANFLRQYVLDIVGKNNLIDKTFNSDNN